MKFTRATEYAFRALRFLASQIEERWFSIQEIAKAEQVPVQFLSKVMQQLSQASIVQSTCGKSGGYRLSKPPDQIRMSDVVLAMEGPVTVNNCLAFPGECSFQNHCKMHPVWVELQEAIDSILSKYDISMIVNSKKRGAKPPVRRTAKKKTNAEASANQQA